MLAQLFLVEGRDRFGLMEQAKQLIHVQAFRILTATTAIGDAGNERVGAVVALENVDHVARDIAIGAAGNFHRELLLGRINAARAQRNLQEHIHAFTGHAVHLVINSSVGLAAHERGWQRILSSLGALHNPLNVVGRNVLVWSKINKFLNAKFVDHLTLGAGLRRDEIKNAIHETFHAASWVRRRLQQQGAFGAALWNILVFLLLRAGQRVDLVVQTVVLTRVLRGVARTHQAQTAACDFLKANMKTVEATAADKEHAEWKIGAQLVLQQFWFQAQRKTKSILQVVISAQRGLHGAQHSHEHGVPTWRPQKLKRCFQHLHAGLKVRVTHWFLWIKSRHQ